MQGLTLHAGKVGGKRVRVLIRVGGQEVTTVHRAKRTGLNRVLFGTGERGAGLDATWWTVASLIAVVAGVGGLINGELWAALFFVPAALQLVMAIKRARKGNV